MFILPEDKSSASYAGSQFGKSISDAFSESFPQGMQRGRLSGALNQLQNGGGNPLQQLSALYSSGATDQQVSNILPLLQQQQANREARNQGQQGGVPQQSGRQIPQNQGIQAQQQPSENGLVTKRHEQAALNPFIPKTPEQIQQDAAILQSRSPALYKDFSDAEAKVLRDEQQRQVIHANEEKAYNTRLKETEDLRSNIETRAKKNLDALNASDLYAEGTGQKLQEWEDQAEREYASGDKTRQQAEKDASDKFKSFADQRLKTEKELKKPFSIRKNLDSFLKNTQKEYKKFGAEEIMKHDLIKAKDLSMPKASEYAYPPSESVSKHLNSIPKEKGGLELGSGFARGTEDLSRTQAYKLSKILTKDDSLLGIANKLSSKGLDPNAFMEEMKTLYDNGYLPNLTDRQIKEFTSVAEIKPTWADMWLDWGL